MTKIVNSHANKLSYTAVQYIKKNVAESVYDAMRTTTLQEGMTDLPQNLAKNYIGCYKYSFKDKGELKNKIQNCNKILSRLAEKIQGNASDNVIVVDLDDIVFIYNEIEGVDKISLDDNDSFSAGDVKVLTRATDDLRYLVDANSNEENKLAESFQKLVDSFKDGDLDTNVKGYIDRLQSLSVNRYKIDTFLDSVVSVISELLK